MERFEASGRWWLPGGESQQVSGALVFEPENGPTLEAVGSLRTEDLFTAGSQECPIILGLAGGKLITLFRCYESQLQIHGVGEPSSTYKARYMFVGAHIESTESVRFEAVAIAYSNLDHWTQRSGLSRSLSSSEPIQIDIQYIHPPAVGVSLEGGTIVSLLSEFSTSGDLITSAGIQQRTLFRIEPPSRLGIDEYLDGICWHLQTLVTFALSRPQFITQLQATLPVTDDVRGAEREARRARVEVLFGQQQWKESGIPGAFDMLFSLGDLGDTLGVRLHNWTSKGEKLRPVFSLYFGMLFNPSMYVEHQFLNVVQAIESYHRRVYGGKYLEPGSFEEVYETLVAAIPRTGNEGFESALKGRLKYHNEFSLRRRLENLLERLDTVAAPVLPGSGAFVSQVVDTRNYLTHYDTEVKKGAKSGPRDLFNLTQRLKVLLEVCFLFELEFPKDTVKRMIVRSRAYRYVMQQDGRGGN